MKQNQKQQISVKYWKKTDLSIDEPVIDLATDQT